MRAYVVQRKLPKTAPPARPLSNGIRWFLPRGHSCRTGVKCSNPNDGLGTGTGFTFDNAAEAFSGEDAVTTNCARGLAGTASRRCVWVDPHTPTGTWANPINNCQRTASNQLAERRAVYCAG